MNKIKRILNQYSYKYLKTFSKEDFLRYQEMLMLTSREQLGESYLLKEKWSSDIVNIREITWQDVTEYMLDTPSTYTKEWLKKVIRGIWLFCVWSCKKTVIIVRFYKNQNFASSNLRLMWFKHRFWFSRRRRPCTWDLFSYMEWMRFFCHERFL